MKKKNPTTTNLMTALRGGVPEKIPFFEVWFCKGFDYVEETLGRPVNQNDNLDWMVPLADKLGWEWLKVSGGGAGLPVSSGEAGDGTTHYIQGGLHSREQLEQIIPPDLNVVADRVGRTVAAAHAKGYDAIGYLGWCFHAVATAMGLEAFAYKAVDDIDFLHTAMNIVEDYNRRVIREVFVPMGVDVVMFDGDCAYKSGLMVHPDMLRELVFERTVETTSALRDADIPYCLHSDGKCDELLPMLIELGFCGFHGVEAAANDLGDIKERFGDKITLIGNMDTDFLTHAAPGDIRDATRRMLDIGRPGGRYAAACNTSPCAYIPNENYRTFVETIRAYG